MKIKITENQAKRLKLINEETDIISQLEQFSKIKSQEINNIFLKLSETTINEIIGGSVNLPELSKHLDNIDSGLYAANKKAYAFIETLPDENLDLRIDRAFSSLNLKLTSVNMIVNELKKLSDILAEHNVKDVFKEAKPIEIGN